MSRDRDDDGIDVLPRDVLELLAGDRARAGMSPEASTRVLARLERSLALPPPGAPPGGASTPPAAVMRGASRGAIARAAGTLVIGGLVGAAIHAGVAPPPRTVTVTRTVFVSHAQPLPARAPDFAPPPPPPPPVEAPAVVAVVRQPARPTLATSEPDARGSLAAERAVLDVARTALGRGQHAAAFATLERHAHRFPDGWLAEERESMAVQALVGAARFDDARARAARFRARFPGSLLGAAVDAAVRAIP